jgi:hypothetical protein
VLSAAGRCCPYAAAGSASSNARTKAAKRSIEAREAMGRDQRAPGASTSRRAPPVVR